MEDTQRVLLHFRLGEKDRLGEGIEAAAYALDSNRILRIPKSRKPQEMEDRQRLLMVVARGSYPYEIPRVLEIGEIDGAPYSIEALVPGWNMREKFRGLRKGDQAKAVESFFGAIEPLSSADVSALPYGELIGEGQLTRDSWAAYVRARVEAPLSRAYDALKLEVPNLELALDRFFAGTEELGGFEGKKLVHGDFYPAHLMLSDDFAVTGLLDFSRLTVVGDPLLDYAEAFSSFEDPRREEASLMAADLFRSMFQDRFGSAGFRRLRTYQLFYALLFSDVASFGSRTYDWCLRTLRGELWDLNQ